MLLWSTIVMPKEDIINWKDLAPSDYHLLGPMKKGLRSKHYASDVDVKTVVIKWFQEQSTEFYEESVNWTTYPPAKCK